MPKRSAEAARPVRNPSNAATIWNAKTENTAGKPCGSYTIAISKAYFVFHENRLGKDIKTFDF